MTSDQFAGDGDCRGRGLIVSRQPPAALDRYPRGFTGHVAQPNRSIQGSHHVFTMPGRRERIVIPIHGNQPLKKGLLRSLMKIAGLQEDDL